MIKRHGITSFVLGVLTLGLLLPLVAGMVLTFSAERKRLLEELHAFQDAALAALAKSVEDSLASFSPSGALNSASMLLNDERVAHIEVYSGVYDMYLVDMPVKSPDEVIQPRTRRQIIVEDGEELGYVSLTIDMSWGDPLIASEQRRTLLLFAAMFLGAMALVIPSVYYKILRPLNQLSDQASRIAAGDLESSTRWNGKDEFSMLGRTMDTMRSRLRQSFNRVQNLAQTDELTGIANRRAFFPKVQQMFESGDPHKMNLCMAILDIDHFKEINDTYGHTKGDEVLVEVAQVISSHIRKSDVLARFGGEEFILCLPGADLQSARKVMEDIRQSMEVHEFPHGQNLTVSIGLAQRKKDQSLESLISHADKALYLAKNRNRNRTETFSEAAV